MAADVVISLPLEEVNSIDVPWIGAVTLMPFAEARRLKSAPAAEAEVTLTLPAEYVSFILTKPGATAEIF